jgi:hypothetical protein
VRRTVLLGSITLDTQFSNTLIVWSVLCGLIKGFDMCKFVYESLTKRNPHRRDERVHSNKIDLHDSHHAFPYRFQRKSCGFFLRDERRVLISSVKVTLTSSVMVSIRKHKCVKIEMTGISQTCSTHSPSSPRDVPYGQTLQLGICFGELGSFGVDDIMEEHYELTVVLDKVREVTLFMSFGKIFHSVVSSFDMVHVVRPKRVFAILDWDLLK